MHPLCNGGFSIPYSILHCIRHVATITHRGNQGGGSRRAAKPGPGNYKRGIIKTMSSAAMAHERVFIGAGLSPFKRVVTILGVIGLTVLVLWIALHEGVPAIGSTIVAVLFIFGFVIFLRMIEPVPFTINLEEEALAKRSKNGDVIEVRWEDLTRIKEEFFPNGKRIGIIVYRKTTSPEQKPKAWAVYRDDVTNLDGLATSLREVIPETCQWQSETVHD